MTDRFASLELTTDSQRITQRLEQYMSPQILEEINTLLLRFGARLALFNLPNNQTAVGVVTIQTGDIIPISVADKKNINYFVLNGTTSILSKRLQRSKQDNGITVLTPHLITAFVESLREYQRECASIEDELNVEAARAFTLVQQMLKKGAKGCSIHEFEMSPLEPSYRVILFKQPFSVLSWNINERNQDKDSFPEFLRWAPHVQAIIIIPASITVEERRRLEEHITTRLQQQQALQPGTVACTVDSHLLSTWETAIKGGESSLVASTVPPESTEHEREEDLEKVRTDVEFYFNSILKDTQITLKRLPHFINGEQVLPDYIFTFTDSSVSHPAYPSLSLYGWQPKTKSGKDAVSPTTYGNVGGLIIVPDTKKDGWLPYRKEISRNAGNTLRQYSPLPRTSTILTVDKSLLQFWKDRGSPFASFKETTEKFQGQSLKRISDYGHQHWRQRDEPPKVTVDWWEPDIGSHIGSPQLRIRSIWDDSYADAFVIDFGWIFSRWKSKGFLDFPRPQDGIGEFLHKKVFRPINRLYRTDLLMFSVDNAVLADVLSHANRSESVYSVNDFLLLELIHRLGEEGLDALLSTSEKTSKYYQGLKEAGYAKRLFAYLKLCEKQEYANKTMYWGLGITHAHQDHTIGRSIIRKAVPSVLTPVTHTFLKTDFLTSSRYTIAETAYMRNYDLPKDGNAWQVEEFPHIYMEDGARMEIAPGFFITAYEGHHSVPGEIGFVWEVMHKGKLVSSGCYGGDDKDGHFFRRLQQHTKDVGPIDIAFIEGTNDERTTKAGAFTNRWDVKRSFEDFFQTHKDQDVVVIDMIKNSIERLFDVIHIAKQTGRTVALSPRILYRITKLGLELQDKISGKKPCRTETEKEFIDILHQLLQWLYGDNFIVCWKRYAQRYETFEKEMFASYGTVTTDDLSLCSLKTGETKQYIVLREFGEDEDKLKGIASNDTVPWIQSTYAAYDAQARLEKSIREEFAATNNFQYINKGFHTSGHGVHVGRNHPYAKNGIAEESSKVGFNEVVLIHLQKSREYISQQVLPTYPGYKGTTIHTRIAHPNPSITPQKQFERTSNICRVPRRRRT